jgi:hypothetical protein
MYKRYKSYGRLMARMGVAVESSVLVGFLSYAHNDNADGSVTCAAPTGVP